MGRIRARGSSSGGRPETVRLFVALELPRPARAALARWAAAAAAAAVTAAATDVRPLPEDSLHVTLCFLGACEPGEVEPIADAVRAAVAVAGTSPVGLELGEPLWLPRRRARVCAVELREMVGGVDVEADRVREASADRARGVRADDDSPTPGALAGLQAAVAASLVAGGWYAPERRPFLPHVSVARLSSPLRRRGPALAAPALEPFTAPGVALLRSWPGSRYESLARFALPS